MLATLLYVAHDNFTSVVGFMGGQNHDKRRDKLGNLVRIP